jgi:hypothetical protein
MFRPHRGRGWPFLVRDQRLSHENPDRQQQQTAGGSHRRQARLPLVKANIRRFADNEIFVEILENVRGEDVFVVQSTSFPANDHLMELLIIIDCAAPLVGRAHHRGDALLRLRPPGPQDRIAHADHGQAGRQPDHQCRRPTAC